MENVTNAKVIYPRIEFESTCSFSIVHFETVEQEYPDIIERAIHTRLARARAALLFVVKIHWFQVRFPLALPQV